MKKSSKKTNKKNSWENDKSIRIIFILIIIVSLGIMSGTIGYSIYKWNIYQSKIISINYVNTSIQVVSYGVGMNGDRDSLKFGKNMPGGGGERHLLVNSTREAKVEVVIYGDMAIFLTVDKNDFIVKPRIQDDILFNLEIPEGTAPENYTGIVQLTFLKP